MEGQSGSSMSMACVTVLVGEGRPVPEPFLANLRRRGGEPHVVYSAPATMLELARQQSHVLVIVDPNHVRRLDALLQAVNQCYPRVACWRFEPDRQTGACLARLGTSAGNDAHAMDAMGPQRMDKRQNSPDRPQRSWPPVEELTSAVTAEELAMLTGPLGGDSSAQPHRPSGGHHS